MSNNNKNNNKKEGNKGENNKNKINNKTQKQSKNEKLLSSSIKNLRENLTDLIF